MLYKTKVIQARIKELGLTQESIAEKLYTDNGNFSKIINNEHKIFKIETATRIANIIDLQLDKILDGTDLPFDSFNKNIENKNLIDFQNLYKMEKEDKIILQRQLTDALCVIETQCKIIININSLRK